MDIVGGGNNYCVFGDGQTRGVEGMGCEALKEKLPKYLGVWPPRYLDNGQMR